MFNKTIAAISTAYGKGGVAIIRISGDESLSVAKKMLRLKSNNIEPRRAYYCEILSDNEVIDDGILTYFKGPNSFTGEDVCEICCHGGIYVTRAVLQSAYASGAQPASAGEFTRRAYVNGKLTLSRAEAIGNVIDAKTDAQMRLSSSQARGILSSKIEKIRQSILSSISHAYATIDYPDEDIEEAEREEISTCLDLVISSLEELKKSYRAGRAVSEGIKCAIIGKPNAGKSSVYNMLLGQEAAIVTDIAGTTRDVIESTLSLGGVTLNIADTAGIHDTQDRVEKIGIERAKTRASEAELLLCVFDSSQRESDEDEYIIECANGKSAIAIINKSDKSSALSREFENKISSKFSHVVHVSAKNYEGAGALGDIVSKMYDLGDINLSSDAVISSARAFSSVSLALEKALDAREALLLGQTPDIICFALENALCELDMIDGRGASEEIVNTIFSRFCVGK